MGRFREVNQSLFDRSKPNHHVVRLVLVVPVLVVLPLVVVPPLVELPPLVAPAVAVVRLAAIEEA
jgi:hypothetical protein